MLQPSQCTLAVVIVAGGLTHALPHYMQLQCQRVYSLEFLPVAELEVMSPSEIPFCLAGMGDITC